MAAYKIIFDRDVERDLAKIPKKIVKVVLKKTLALGHQPNPSQSLKISGTDVLYRLRAGDYRILYSIDNRLKEITIYHIRHRKDVYRNL